LSANIPPASICSPGTETIGSMLVSLWAAGAIDIVAALSFINILLVVWAWYRPALWSEIT
jgi:ABC-type Fe3+ transport system permease subunit